MKRGKVLELTVFALLGALMFCAKMVMAALPNIEPVSLLILVYTAVFGKKAIYPLYVYVMLEFLIWGLGLWNINYLYVWLVLYFLGLLFQKMESSWCWAILAAAFGLGFGLLCTPVYCVSGGWAFGLSWWVSGIPYDVLHCAGNFAMVLVLRKPLIRVLSAMQKKYLVH